MKTEQELAAIVVQHFESIPGAEVWQEVKVRRLGRRADIVVGLGPVLHVIETKMQFGLSVLEQAAGWRGVAHRVSIATPYRGRHAFGESLCESLGVGWFYVHNSCESAYGIDRLSENVEAPLRRRVGTALRAALRDEHKTFAAAGNATCSYWTPWQATCKAAREFVGGNPGCTVRDLVAGIRHHHSSDSSARQNLARWIVAQSVAGIRADRIDGKLRCRAVPMDASLTPHSTNGG